MEISTILNVPTLPVYTDWRKGNFYRAVLQALGPHNKKVITNLGFNYWISYLE